MILLAADTVHQVILQVSFKDNFAWKGDNEVMSPVLLVYKLLDFMHSTPIMHKLR